VNVPRRAFWMLAAYIAHSGGNPTLPVLAHAVPAVRAKGRAVARQCGLQVLEPQDPWLAFYDEAIKTEVQTEE
jgi:hypothetical protein